MAQNSSEFIHLLKRLESATLRLEELTKGAPAAPSGPHKASAPTTTSPSLNAFSELMETRLSPFLALAQRIGGVVDEQAKYFKQAFEVQQRLLVTASQSKKPDAAGLQGLLKPCSEMLMKVAEIRDKNRTSPLFNHLSMVSEGVPALGWVAVVCCAFRQEESS
jgi:adenylyl cyclase-associated protein